MLVRKVAACAALAIFALSCGEDASTSTADASADNDAGTVAAPQDASTGGPDAQSGSTPDAGAAADADLIVAADAEVSAPGDAGVTAPADAEVASPADAGAERPDAQASVPADAQVSVLADAEIAVPADAEVIVLPDAEVPVQADGGFEAPPDAGAELPDAAEPAGDDAGTPVVPDSGLSDYPPIAQASNPTGSEDVPLVIQLGYVDVEGDLVRYVVDGLGANDCGGVPGRLFQYDAQLAAGDLSALSSAVEITSFPATVDPGADGKVIYLGPTNCNTDALPAELFIYPSLTFHVEELDSLLSSAPLSLNITLQAVNDAPRVWAPDAARSFLPGEMCWDSCTYDEDLGHPRGVVYDPVIIYAGGRDPEHVHMKVITLRTTCPRGSLWFADDKAQVPASPAVPTHDLQGFLDGRLMPAWYFRPLADTYGSPYCEIEYRVNDQELDSLDTRTVVLNILPVNDLPRIDEELILTKQDTPVEFDVHPSDPEGDAFTGTLMSCLSDATSGSLEYLDGTQWLAVDCASLAATPMELAPSAASWRFRYTPAPGVIANEAMIMDLKLEDGITPVTVDDWWHVYVNVLPP